MNLLTWITIGLSITIVGAIGHSFYPIRVLAQLMMVIGTIIIIVILIRVNLPHLMITGKRDPP